MKPGDPATKGTVDIKNTGSLAGVFTVGKTAQTNSDGANPMAAKLNVILTDCGTDLDCVAGTNTVKYTGTLAAMGTGIALSTLRRQRGASLRVLGRPRRHAPTTTTRATTPSRPSPGTPSKEPQGSYDCLIDLMFARRVGRLLAGLLVAAGFVFGALLVAPSLLGWERYVIVSGSMTGTYDRGSLVFDEVVPVESLKVGDVITYKPPPGSGPHGLVTHRIAKISKDPKSGERVYRTKGDANQVADPWKFLLPDKEQARVVAGVPKVGFVLAALAQREIRMLIIGLPALLIALFVMGGLWRDAGREAEAQAATASAPSAA